MIWTKRSVNGKVIAFVGGDLFLLEATRIGVMIGTGYRLMILAGNMRLVIVEVQIETFKAGLR